MDSNSDTTVRVTGIRICSLCGKRVAHPETGLCPTCDDDWPESVKES